MLKLTSSLYFKSFLLVLAFLSLGFIGTLAVVDPVCTHCTMSIAYKAMLGAKFLSAGWLFAGALYCWDSRYIIRNRCPSGMPANR